MTTDELVERLQEAGVELSLQGERLHVDAPQGVITPELREALTEHKAALLKLLTMVIPPTPVQPGTVSYHSTMIIPPDRAREPGLALLVGQWHWCEDGSIEAVFNTKDELKTCLDAAKAIREASRQQE